MSNATTGERKTVGKGDGEGVELGGRSRRREAGGGQAKRKRGAGRREGKPGVGRGSARPSPRGFGGACRRRRLTCAGQLFEELVEKLTQVLISVCADAVVTLVCVSFIVS